MRHLIVLVLIIWHMPVDRLVGTTWEYHVTKTGVNTMKFTSNKTVKSYDCELNYTFTDTYLIKSDTLIVTEKDDSHSEDGGKNPSIFERKYLIRKDIMVDLGYRELFRGHWTNHFSKQNDKVFWRKRSSK